jgi:catechol 2,3-dioxygenase-like lactoylglutathione lyase family enzyme
MTMRATISFITLAVEDLNRSVAFYRDGLGWPTEGNSGYFTDPDGHLFEIAWNSSQ